MSGDWVPWENVTQTCGREGCEGRGRDWDVASSQGITGQKLEEAEKDSSLEPVEEASLASSVISDFWLLNSKRRDSCCAKPPHLRGSLLPPDL